MNDALLTFRKNLQTFMEVKGYNQTSLANEIGVTNATISKWILGKSEPSFKYIDLLCDALDCTRSQLVEIPQTPQTIMEQKRLDRLLAYYKMLTPDGVEKTLEYFEDLNPKFYKGEE